MMNNDTPHDLPLCYEYEIRCIVDTLVNVYNKIRIVLVHTSINHIEL